MFFLVQEEDSLLVQEDNFLLVQEEHLLLVQEENLLIVQDNYICCTRRILSSCARNLFFSCTAAVGGGDPPPGLQTQLQQQRGGYPFPFTFEGGWGTWYCGTRQFVWV